MAQPEKNRYTSYRDILQDRAGGPIPYVSSLDNSPFAGDHDLSRSVFGGKGLGLMEMTSWGLPVPPGFVITTEAWRVLYFDSIDFATGKRSLEILGEEKIHAVLGRVDEELARLEEKTGRLFDDREKPLFVSVRSGAPASMPGELESVLYVGTTDETVIPLALEIGEKSAYQAYYNLITSIGSRYFNKSQFAGLLGGRSLSELTADELKTVVAQAKEVFYAHAGKPFPQKAVSQIVASMASVFESWDKPGPVRQRDLRDMDYWVGTACVVQQMIFTNREDVPAGSGVLFTQDTVTLEPTPVLSYLPGAQGTAVVGEEKHQSYPLDQIPDGPMKLQLKQIVEVLNEHHPYWPQDVEFSFDGMQVWLLQKRDAPISTAAKFRFILNGLRHFGFWNEQEAMGMLAPPDLEAISRPGLDEGEVAKATQEGRLLATGQRIAPGLAIAPAKLSMDEALKASEPVIYIGSLSLNNIDNFPMKVVGLATDRAGLGSHVARKAEAWGAAHGRPAVFGLNLLEGKQINAGDPITLDATTSTGRIFRGGISFQQEGGAILNPEEIRIAQSWLEERRQNPWRFLADPEKMEQFTDHARAILNDARRQFQAHKALETAVMMTLIPPEMREAYYIIDPRDEVGVKSLLKEILAEGNHASIRTCHHPRLPGRAPWAKIQNEEDIEKQFELVDGSSQYEQLIRTVDGCQVERVLVGSFPKDKLNPDLASEHCAWTLQMTSDAELVLQVRPHTVQLRSFSMAKTDELLMFSRGPIRPKLSSVDAPSRSKIVVGDRWKDDEVADGLLHQVIRETHRFQHLELFSRLAAIAEVFPYPYFPPPVLEGQARKNVWCLIYGINVDPMDYAMPGKQQQVFPPLT